MTWIVTVESRRTHSHRELHKYSETKASEPSLLHSHPPPTSSSTSSPTVGCFNSKGLATSCGAHQRGRSRPTASAMGTSRFHVPSRRAPTTREVSQHRQLSRNTTFPMLPLQDTHTVQRKWDPLFAPRLHWVPYHLDALLLRYKPASLAAASVDNARATSAKATKPLPRGRMRVLDRQDHESSCPSEEECSHSR